MKDNCHFINFILNVTTPILRNMSSPHCSVLYTLSNFVKKLQKVYYSPSLLVFSKTDVTQLLGMNSRACQDSYHRNDYLWIAAGMCSKLHVPSPLVTQSLGFPLKKKKRHLKLTWQIFLPTQSSRNTALKSKGFPTEDLKSRMCSVLQVNSTSGILHLMHHCSV